MLILVVEYKELLKPNDLQKLENVFFKLNIDLLKAK
jgi:hypothetical protein